MERVGSEARDRAGPARRPRRRLRLRLEEASRQARPARPCPGAPSSRRSSPPARPCGPRVPRRRPAVDGQVKFVARLQGGIALVQLRNRAGSGVPARRAGRACTSSRAAARSPGATGGRRPRPRASPRWRAPPSSLLALRPGEAAALTVSWDNWCDPKVPGKPHLPPSAMRITLPRGRGHVDADYNAVPPCLDPSRAVDDRRLGLPARACSRRSGRGRGSTCARRSPASRCTRAAAADARASGSCSTTSTASTARFDRCPAYVEQLAPVGGVEVYELNCAAAHAIPPGGSEAFAMRAEACRRTRRSAPTVSSGRSTRSAAASPQLNARVLVDGGE